MTTPRCGLLFHFTHVDNLPEVLNAGALLSDTVVYARGLLSNEAGDREIKQRRREQLVTCPPRGVVADYVPFYFAARSPMMFKLFKGSVPTFTGDHRDLVYLVSDVDRMVAAEVAFAISDRNAAKALAEFSNDVAVLGDLTAATPQSDFIDWPLMRAQMWNNTPSDGERLERRMAEFLVHEKVPLDLLLGVGVRSDAHKAIVEQVSLKLGRVCAWSFARTGITRRIGGAMIREQQGNLLDADVDALVNTVNTVGVMGKGIALQFKRAFPENYKAYKRACDAGEVELGRMFVWDAGALASGGPRYVINFPTKRHWRSKSTLADIRAGLDDLVRQIGELSIKSVAVPPLGCGHGGLRWAEVRPLIVSAFEQLPDVDALLYLPEGAPAAADQPVRTERPKMTPGRAALVGVMQRYLPYSVEITAVDIQKIMYFMQEAGEPLRLAYAKGRYGPYAGNLRHVLAAMEGHYIRGVGDGSTKALDSIPFEILDGASDAAATVLDGQPDTAARMDRVAKLIEGFESTYGLELLATVHWAASRDEAGNLRAAPLDLEGVDRVVRSWNRRKGRLFAPKHVAVALDRLGRLGWLRTGEREGLLA